MSPWHHGRLLAFDTETTGPNPDHARIVTATLVHLDGPHRSLRRWVRGVREWLVDPGVDIPAGASAVHGITTEHAQEVGADSGQAIFELTGEIALALRAGAALVGFNLAYDLTVLDRECRRHQVDTLASRLGTHDGDHRAIAPVVDAFVLDKAVDRFRKGSRKLTAVAAHYGIDLEAAHTSSADALAAAQVACAIAERDQEVGGCSVMSLHGQQVLWRAQQSASLQAYFRRTRPDAIVDGAWPVQPVAAGWDPLAHPVEDEAVTA